jgi:FixJ family two-component response regulator
MRSAGHRPLPFESAESALRALSHEQPDCILLDLTLPGIGGLEFQERLRHDDVRIPVIAVSARDDDETRRRAREMGARLFLRKPVDAQALLDAIDRSSTQPVQDRPMSPPETGRFREVLRKHRNEQWNPSG